MKNDFIEKFAAADNLPENMPQRESIIMEARASLVIEANISSGRFPSFFMDGINPRECVAMTPAEAKDTSIQFELGKMHYAGNAVTFSTPSEECPEQTALSMSLDAYVWCRLDHAREWKYLFPADCWGLKKDCPEHILRRAALNGVRSAFGVARDKSPCNTPEKACAYWGQETTPYAPFRNLREFHRDLWHELPQTSLERIQPILPSSEFVIRKHFAFKGRNEETLLRVLRLDYEEGKLLLPLTSWFRNGNRHPMLFFACGEEKLPLFNLEQLTDCGDKTVILTDSIEIAAKNQGQFDNTVWTSFYGDWHYTDWAPLKEVRQVVLLVTNHSGRSLAATYGTAKELSNYLLETVGLENLGYIQLQTDYDAEQPEMNPESYLEMNKEEFRAMAERAEDTLKPRPEFWAKPVVNRTDAPVQTKELLHVEQQPYRYLLRPFLVDGTTSLIHAPKGVGKSTFGYSIVGALTSIHKTELCPGTWWRAREKPCRVLYLDFENSKSVVSQRLKMFCTPYWGRKDEDNEAGLNNLIIRYGDKLPPCTNYALPENHSAVLKWLDEAEVQGHVDLMVIDTYSRFINSQESTKSVAGFTGLCNLLNQRGTAVLIIHHSGSDGDVRGFKEKRDILYSCMHLTRARGGPADDLYDAPLKIEWENLREPDYNPSLVIRLTKDGWMPDGIEDKEALEAFRRENFTKIVEQYARLEFKDADMQKMLNIGNSSFYEWKKAVKE